METVQAFIAGFDAALSEFNIEYKQKRESARLHRPRVFFMKKGWAERRHRRDVAGSGKRDSQYKWQVIMMEWDPATRAEVDREVVFQKS